MFPLKGQKKDFFQKKTFQNEIHSIRRWLFVVASIRLESSCCLTTNSINFSLLFVELERFVFSNWRRVLISVLKPNLVEMKI